MKERAYKIVRILLSQDDFITTNQIAQLVNASNKTIRNDMEEITLFLNDHHLNLLKQPGSGIMITGSTQDKLSLLAKYDHFLKQKTDYSPEARILYIALKVLTTPINILYNSSFSKELYASQATINNDLRKVDQLFNSYRIEFNKNSYEINGKERNIRNALVHCLTISNGHTQFSEIIRSNNYACQDQAVFEGTTITDTQIKEMISLVQTKATNSLPSEFTALIVLMTRLLANKIRIDLHQEVYLTQEFVDELETEPGYFESKQILQSLYPEQELSESEIRYLQIYWFSAQHNQPFKDSDILLAQNITDDLISAWSLSTSIDLSKSKTLRHDLIEHLTPAMTRFRHEISVDNPLLTQIKDHYPYEFEIVVNSQNQINQHFLVPVTQNELSFLTIHLVNALNSFKEPLKVLLINNTGLGTGKLLKKTIDLHIPEIELLDVVDYVKFNESKLVETEVILSTIPLSITSDIPVILIDSILIPENIQRLRQIIREYYKKKNQIYLFN